MRRKLCSCGSGRRPGATPTNYAVNPAAPGESWARPRTLGALATFDSCSCVPGTEPTRLAERPALAALAGDSFTARSTYIERGGPRGESRVRTKHAVSGLVHSHRCTSARAYGRRAVKVWWIGAEEPVVPAARLLEKPMMHADLAALAAGCSTAQPDAIRRNGLRRAPAAASSSSLCPCRGA